MIIIAIRTIKCGGEGEGACPPHLSKMYFLSSLLLLLLFAACLPILSLNKVSIFYVLKQDMVGNENRHSVKEGKGSVAQCDHDMEQLYD